MAITWKIKISGFFWKNHFTPYFKDYHSSLQKSKNHNIHGKINIPFEIITHRENKNWHYMTLKLRWLKCILINTWQPLCLSRCFPQQPVQVDYHSRLLADTSQGMNEWNLLSKGATSCIKRVLLIQDVAPLLDKFLDNTQELKRCI